MFLLKLLFSSFLLFLTGCSTIGYYAQSIHGHFSLMEKSRSIDELISDPEVEEALKTKLKRVNEARQFAVEHLHLPDNGSYRQYAQLNRPAVVWSVVATPEFSVQPETWCFLVVGCTSYRGYFSKQRAESFAASLQQSSFDVAVMPVPAYSTLGWFWDPLPSTVINWQESHLVGLMFHELAHQKLYVKGDSAFNESFANAVEQEGVRRWVQRAELGGAFEKWKLQQQREREFTSLLLQARTALDLTYQKDSPDSQKRAEKDRQFAELKVRYGHLKDRWGGYAGYDHWFKRKLNNAHLASVATYERWVPAFQVLLEQANHDMPRFYQLAEALAELPMEERRLEMSRLGKLGKR